jgi:hypothetical protein
MRDSGHPLIKQELPIWSYLCEVWWIVVMVGIFAPQRLSVLCQRMSDRFMKVQFPCPSLTCLLFLGV